MSLPKIILIHGNEGATKDEHWFPWVQNALEKEGFVVICETMPDNIYAHQNVWFPFMKNELGVDANTIIVGHSSGAVAAMRYAENNKLYGSILIGACYTDLGEESEAVSGYYDRPWLWNKIKENQKWIVQFASTDDPYIPIAEARHIHEKLDTEYIEATNMGHYGSDLQEILELPELIGVIKQKCLGV
jgi:hypothetical protein